MKELGREIKKELQLRVHRTFFEFANSIRKEKDLSELIRD